VDTSKVNGEDVLIHEDQQLDNMICVNGGVISWSSKCQPTVALSSAEAEHMAISAAV
jgi:hypothetical protein